MDWFFYDGNIRHEKLMTCNHASAIKLKFKAQTKFISLRMDISHRVTVTARKSFPLMIYPVNVTKSKEIADLLTFAEEIFNGI